MTIEEARRMLAEAEGGDDPVVLPESILAKLTKEDLPPGVSVNIGNSKNGFHYLDWAGWLYVADGVMVAEADYDQPRKYWDSALGLEHYVDLIRRSIETRFRTRGDIKLTDYNDDGTYIEMRATITLSGARTLADAYKEAVAISQGIEEVAHETEAEVSRRVAEVASRLSGWGSQPLDKLVAEVETAKSSDDRGRSLEELCSRLFETVAGFEVTGRIRTATEEIDIAVLNNSDEPRLRRESVLILAECKNWSSKCGKNEFVIFKEKIENRNRRCSLGFLISWNGFSEVVTKEMLRGSHEETLIIPLTSGDIHRAIVAGNFTSILLAAWNKVVTL